MWRFEITIKSDLDLISIRRGLRIYGFEVEHENDRLLVTKFNNIRFQVQALHGAWIISSVVLSGVPGKYTGQLEFNAKVIGAAIGILSALFVGVLLSGPLSWENVLFVGTAFPILAGMSFLIIAGTAVSTLKRIVRNISNVQD